VGSVHLFGVPPIDARSRLALLSHADGHYDELSGRDNLELAKELGRLPGAIDVALDRVGLRTRADDLVRAYSSGMRKRLAFARLLLKSPPLVFLDEPYAALDHDGHALVDRLLGEFRMAGATVLVSTHQVARVRPLCDEAFELQAGSLAVRGPASQIAASEGALAGTGAPVSEPGSAIAEPGAERP
jgi:ABC-type multidrug transport system ATPase subunit